ncbi:unnamed protein product [Kuraishia capsulata CBS 1993]|uniref:Uncharacterized protein n=1 Tax=Kuraishia capsulata CBS 1993 TaxID=1382522 RepID=W6MUB3_9ASCO|nr:uncharacterized protein KUCA_T00005074001 [Kuraishia capsulata CBS 1993]CDK29087.1 unnamed protein product [Kuraishia capsulata CBS 1993]
MAKKQHTTSSTKRFAYTSFRDRVESIDVGVALRTGSRVIDSDAGSYFLTSLAHWQEVNMAKDFTKLSEDIEEYTASYTVLIYYQKDVFKALLQSISECDTLSLEPELELLSQFCHDLGPDFMPYFDQSIERLVEIALRGLDSNCLEWIFNCIAFIFKYLSRELKTDIVRCYKALMPLLDQGSKDFLGRFSAQALSFLVRKAPSSSLKEFVHQAFQELSNTKSEFFARSLNVIFEESLKGASGNLFSKAKTIIHALIWCEDVHHGLGPAVASSIFIGTVEHIEVEEAFTVFHEAIIGEISSLVDSPNFSEPQFVLQVASSLAFAQSGRKVPDWAPLFDICTKVIEKSGKSIIADNQASKLLGYYIVVLTRNSDVVLLNSRLPKILDQILSLGNLKAFLGLVDSCLFIAYDKSSVLCEKFLQRILRDFWQEAEVEISYLLISLHGRDLICWGDSASGKISLSLPKEMIDKFYSAVETLDLTSEEQILELYWRLSVISFTPQKEKARLVLKLIIKIFACPPSIISRKALGAAFYSIWLSSLNENDLNELLLVAMDSDALFWTSDSMLKGFTQCLRSSKDSDHLLRPFQNNENAIIERLTKNLAHYSHDVRLSSLDLLIVLQTILGKTVPRTIIQCQMIELLPLTLQTEREIGSRYRQLGPIYSSENKDALVRSVLAHFLVGQMCVKFRPTWDAALELFPQAISSNFELCWTLIFSMIDGSFLPESDVETTDSFSAFAEETESISHMFMEQRINSSFFNFVNLFLVYNKINVALNNELRKDVLGIDSKYIQSQGLKVLHRSPQLAEKHFTHVVPFILAPDGQGAGHEITNDLIRLLPKFNNLPVVARADELYQFMLTLLTNKFADSQKMALDALLNWKIPTLSKYKDNLKNLLDESIFRDEIAKLFSKSENVLEEDDKKIVIPLVLRILFGKMQSGHNVAAKHSRRSTAVGVLMSIDEEYVRQFLDFGSERIDPGSFMTDQDVDVSTITERELNKQKGFLGFLKEVTSSLGSRKGHLFADMVEPLVFSMLVAQKILDSPESSSTDSLQKVAQINRQTGFVCLNEMMELLVTFDWSPYVSLIYHKIIAPRLDKFSDENAQQPSSMLKLLCLWCKPQFRDFLFEGDHGCVLALLELMANVHAKPAVIVFCLNFFISIISEKTVETEFLDVLAQSIAGLLNVLPQLTARSTSSDVSQLIVNLISILTSKGFVDEADERKVIAQILNEALAKNHNELELSSRILALQTYSSLLSDLSLSLNEVQPLYEFSSKALRNCASNEMRNEIVNLLVSIGNRFQEFENAATLAADLNSFSGNQFKELDLGRRVNAFAVVNDVQYQSLSFLEWLPIVETSMYYINNEEEFSIRTCSQLCLSRFIDAAVLCQSDEQIPLYISYIKTALLPGVKSGLKKKLESVQTEYLKVLQHIVESSQKRELVPGFTDLQFLLFNGDEEADFFANVNHIQLHRRQRALWRLRENASKFTSSSIVNYLLPIAERYALSKEEKFGGISASAVEAIGALMKYVEWGQWKMVMKKYTFMLNHQTKDLASKDSLLKNAISLVVCLCQSLRFRVSANETNSQIHLVLPDQKSLNSYILNSLFPPLRKVLALRDENTSSQRIALSEGMVSLAVCLDEESLNTELPGILTNVCQVLRARSDELRDNTRKHLGNCALILGPKYMKFIIKELKGALTRGPQVHILSFTAHFLLVKMEDQLSSGDLSDSVELLADIIMEDIFGTAGQEKDADGYRSKMKETRFNKSYDTAEILAGKVYLKDFNALLAPVKLLMMEKLSKKTQISLTELMRRYSVGLISNSASGSLDAFAFCFELMQEDGVSFAEQSAKKDLVADHFRVKLDRKANEKAKEDGSAFTLLLHRFALEYVRGIISRNQELMQTQNLEPFVPRLEQFLESDDESIICLSFRVLSLIIRLPFSKEVVTLFKSASRDAMKIIKESLSTNTEMCQQALRYISTVLRQRPEIEFKTSSLSFVLKKVVPDLDEKSKQSAAFGLLRALLSRHVMLPEIYDIMDKVSEIMITNHSDIVRESARSSFLTFLMEYDQGKGRLANSLKTLIKNLNYPTPEGKQSVMEIMNQLLSKSGENLVKGLSSSFFLPLCIVAVTDNSASCREMATTLITLIIQRLGPGECSFIESCATTWLTQTKNESLTRCGLLVFRLLFAETGLEDNSELRTLGFKFIANVIQKAGDSDQDTNQEDSWELVYSVLTSFSEIVKSEHSFPQKDLWPLIMGTLLFPHGWVRLVSVKLLRDFFAGNPEQDVFKAKELQSIGSRVFRQFGANSITEDLANQAMALLLILFKNFSEKSTVMVNDQDSEAETGASKLATNWMTERAALIIRLENSSQRAKQQMIKFVQFSLELADVESAEEVAETIILALFSITEPVAEVFDEDMKNAGLECLDSLSKKLGVQKYQGIFLNAKKLVDERRMQRKSKRAQMAISMPDVASRRKLKKHANYREKRKHEKDENGFYHKRKRV